MKDTRPTQVELAGVEEEPFARGGQGTVHLAEYQGDAVCCKRISQLGVTAAKRQKLFSATCPCGAHAGASRSRLLWASRRWRVWALRGRATVG